MIDFTKLTPEQQAAATRAIEETQPNAFQVQTIKPGMSQAETDAAWAAIRNALKQ